MRPLAALAISLAALAAVAVPVAAASPVTVGGRDGWVSTGRMVDAGQRLAVQTLGSVHTAPIPAYHRPGEFKSASDPAGQDTEPTCGEVTAGFPPGLIDTTGACALDDAYFGELIGRVGDTVFRIGATAEIVLPVGGMLELAANDLVLTYGDNTGAFTVIFR